jgi:tRNA threonylcarbamoyladenosine biosynthesis protein TsaB
MKILSLDTATEACSVAVAVDNEVIERTVMGRQHAERILELIEEVLGEAQLAPVGLDGIAFGRGPGMFTGLRIGAGVTQGIAFAADLPVVPVSTLRVLAQGQPADRIFAALDARMDQVYWGCFIRDANGIMQAVDVERVQSPHHVSPVGRDWVGIGSGWDRYHQELLPSLTSVVTEWIPQAFPSAGVLARLGAIGLAQGEGVSAERAVPVYIRDDVAKKPTPA